MNIIHKYHNLHCFFACQLGNNWCTFWVKLFFTWNYIPLKFFTFRKYATNLIALVMWHQEKHPPLYWIQKWIQKNLLKHFIRVKRVHTYMSHNGNIFEKFSGLIGIDFDWEREGIYSTLTKKSSWVIFIKKVKTN